MCAVKVHYEESGRSAARGTFNRSKEPNLLDTEICMNVGFDDPGQADIKN
jgi:Flp pilus assembly protein TadB